MADYPNLSYKASGDAEKDLRLHQWLVCEALDNVIKAKVLMGKVEGERAKRYGRLDAIAVEAHKAAEQCKEASEKIADVLGTLEKQRRQS